MVGTSVESEPQRRADEREKSRRVLLDRLEPRIVTLLIVAPPTLGMMLGGVMVSAYRRWTGSPSLPGDYTIAALRAAGQIH